MKTAVIRTLSGFIFFITLLSTTLTAGSLPKVEIFYLNHRPAINVLNKVEQLLQRHSITNVSKYDFDSEESHSKMEKYNLRDHTPVAIFINGKNSFVVNSKTVVLRNFPKSDAFVPMFKGDWDYPQLEAILEQESR
jgi:hypothetical protein